MRGLLTDIISPVYSDKTYRQHPYERIACWTGEEGKPLAWQNLLHKYGEVDMLDGKRQAADADVHITTEETARGEFAKGMPRVRACFV